MNHEDETSTVEDINESWAIVELMGHIRMAGRLTEEERFGGKLGRLDVPGEDDTFTTVYFNSNSLYRLTVSTEAVARRVAEANRPRPVHAYEMPEPIPRSLVSRHRDDDRDDDIDFGDDDDADDDLPL